MGAEILNVVVEQLPAAGVLQELRAQVAEDGGELVEAVAAHLAQDPDGVVDIPHVSMGKTEIAGVVDLNGIFDYVNAAVDQLLQVGRKEQGVQQPDHCTVCCMLHNSQTACIVNTKSDRLMVLV